MDYLENLIGKEARRVTFYLKDKNETCYLLMSIIEILEPDMQDCDFPSKDLPPYSRTIKDTSKSHNYQVFMVIDWVLLDEEFLTSPNLSYEVGDENIKCFNDKFNISPAADEPPYVLLGSYDDSNDEILQILPKRQCSKYLYSYIDDNRCVYNKMEEKGEEYLKKKLSSLSTQHFGVDLSSYPQFFGNIYLVQYNSYFRHIGITELISPPGLFVNFLFRPNVKGYLMVRIAGKSREGYYAYEKDFKISTEKNEHFLELPSSAERTDIKVFDDKGNIVYCYDNMSFIKSISFEMNVVSKQIELKCSTNKGEEKVTVNKFSPESFTIGEPLSRKINLLRESPNAYKILEDNLIFLFFDGDKNNKKANINKAQVAIKKIIGKARKQCTICDPYFNLADLCKFVFTIQSMDVSIRILSSKEFIGEKPADKKKNCQAIDDAIKKYKTKVGVEGDIEFRLLGGKAILHDRLIIADNNVWLLGASFNAFGNRATSIAKVPQESCMRICKIVEQWWEDKDHSISLKDYINGKR